MTTGDFWNTVDPLVPWGFMDPDDVLTLPFDYSEWLEVQNTTYSAHNIVCEVGLNSALLSAVEGIIMVQIAKDPEVELLRGKLYKVTCQLLAADGQKRSQTLNLKIREL